MKVLVTTTPAHGHFFPVVPLAWALRCAGHQVLVAAPGDFADAVGVAGLSVVATVDQARFEELMFFDREGRPVERRSDPEGRLIASGRGWARLAARALPTMLDLVRTWGPDLVISEPCEFAGRIAAADRGVPWVEHTWGLAIRPLLRQAAADELAPELTGLAMAALPEPDLVVDLCLPRLQWPDAPPARTIRCTPFNGSARLPAWVWEKPSRPRICLTMGTMLPRMGANGVTDLVADLVAELPGLGVEVIVAMAPDSLARMPQLPPGVRLAGWLPLSQVLPSCEVLIHHGGGGSMMAAIAAGVPQLVLPKPPADMIDNAERVAALGLGLALLPGQVTTEGVLQACAALLRDPEYRQNALVAAAETAAQTAPAEIVSELELLAERSARTARPVRT